MNPDSEVRRFCQLVLADTSLQEAQQRGLSVEMALKIPQRVVKASSETVGGYMGVPLREVRFGKNATPIVVDEFLGPERVRRKEECVLVLDSGSQGFWVMDFTEGADGSNLLSPTSLGTYKGDYELVLGDRPTKRKPAPGTFTIKIPQQWRGFEGGEKLLRMPPTIVKGQKLQCIIVGNPWLQALALTFDVARMRVALSHLDSNGDRCRSYQGPSSTASAASSSLAAIPTSLREARLPYRDGKLLLPSLAQTSLATAAPEAQKQPIATDVALDMRFMTYPQETEGEASSLVSAETQSATALVLPCLDVVVTNSQGRQAYISQIFDTGSGVNLLVGAEAEAASLCEPGACFCEGGGWSATSLERTCWAGRMEGAAASARIPRRPSRTAVAASATAFAARPRACLARTTCRAPFRTAPGW